MLSPVFIICIMVMLPIVGGFLYKKHLDKQKEAEEKAAVEAEEKAAVEAEEKAKREAIMTDTLIFKITTDSDNVSKIIQKTSEINRLWIKGGCSVIKPDIKRYVNFITGLISLSYSFMSTSCLDFLEQYKEEINKNFEIGSKGRTETEKKNARAILDLIIEIAELIIPNEICSEDQIDLMKIQNYLYDIIDAVCDGNSIFDNTKVGYKFKTDSNLLKKIIFKTNAINESIIKNFVCTSSDSKINAYMNSYYLSLKKADGDDITCSEFIESNKKYYADSKERLIESIVRAKERGYGFSRENTLKYYDDTVNKIIEIVEIISTETCVNGKISKDKIEELGRKIVSSFCRPYGIDISKNSPTSDFAAKKPLVLTNETPSETVLRVMCFDAETQVVLTNGTTKRMIDIKIGDVLLNDAKVVGTMKFSGKDIKMSNYDGIISTPNHHVLHDGKFKRVSDVPTSVNNLYDKQIEYVYDLETTDHRIVCLNDKNEWVVYTDFSEIDDNNLFIENYELSVLNKI